VLGMRREEAALGGGARPGARCPAGVREGGGMRFGTAFFASGGIGLGGGAMLEARCALLAAGKEGTDGESGVDAGSESSWPFRENIGTFSRVLTGSAFGVLSPSSSPSVVPLQRSPLGLCSSIPPSVVPCVAFPDRSQCGNRFQDIFGS